MLKAYWRLLSLRSLKAQLWENLQISPVIWIPSKFCSAVQIPSFAIKNIVKKYFPKSVI
jgi:hypothetical protein